METTAIDSPEFQGQAAAELYDKQNADVEKSMAEIL